MFIHQFDSLTGAYQSSRLADPDPASEDRWLVPAFCTTADLPARVRNTWPFFVDGQWELRPDFRGKILYRQDSGEAAEVLVPDVRPEDVGLTTEPRPSGEHVFVDGAWKLDDAAVLAKLRADRMSEFDLRMERARGMNVGKSDALAAGLLSQEEIGLFKAWAEYQMALTRVINSPDFPRVCEWPEEPDEAAAKEAGRSLPQPTQFLDVSIRGDGSLPQSVAEAQERERLLAAEAKA